MSIEKFLIGEFLSFDDSTIESIIEEYKKLHAASSPSYFKKKILDWKKNPSSITDLMKRRILELIPRHLSEENIFHLLKIEVKSQIIQLREKYRHHPKLINEISDVYQIEVELISKINKFSSTFLEYKLNLSQEDKIKYLEILKYLLKQRLKLSYEQVIRDFDSISYLLSNIKQNWGKFEYTIDYLNCKVNINNDFGDMLFFPLRRPVLDDANVQFQYNPYVDDFLYNDLNKIDYLKTSENIEKIYNKNDFDPTIESFNKLLSHDEEGVIESEFKGFGGVLSVSITVKSLKKIQSEFYINVVLLFSIYFLSMVSTSLLFVFGSVNIFSIIFYPLLLWFCIVLFKIYYEELIELKLNLKMYSR